MTAATAEHRRWERLAALVLTALFVALAIVRMVNAGGLWRDEAGAARLATLPTLREVVGLFPHEAFPPLFALTVRTYTHLAGSGDLALRGFGLAVGLAIAGILWLNARTTARTVPLLSLALLGLDAPFLVIGDSLRGYGMGSALILLTYGSLARALAEEPAGRPAAGAGRPWLARGSAWAALTALLAVASVQVVIGNAALLLALCAAAAAVALARRRWLTAAAVAGCGAVAALSLLPYAAELATARQQWSVIVTYRVGARQIWRTLIATVGPRPVLVIWLLLVIVGLAALARAVLRRRDRPASAALGRANRGDLDHADLEHRDHGHLGADDRNLGGRDRVERQEPSRRLDVAAFAGLTLVGSVIACGAFLEHLGYPPRPWYFLPLLALAASALDTLFGALGTLGGTRARRSATLRLIAVGLVAAAQAVPLWHLIAVRQTNADVVAQEVTESAEPQDLIVVVPWYYGVSFNRYYTGTARWLTLPEIPDHRVHRYDLLKARLAARHPLDDLLLAVATTLRSGHRVWLVGSASWPKPGEAVSLPAPAPSTPAGWHDAPYLVSWSHLFCRFLEVHAGVIASVPVPGHQPVSGLENLRLAVVQGWH